MSQHSSCNQRFCITVWYTNQSTPFYHQVLMFYFFTLDKAFFFQEYWSIIYLVLKNDLLEYSVLGRSSKYIFHLKILLKEPYHSHFYCILYVNINIYSKGPFHSHFHWTSYDFLLSLLTSQGYKYPFSLLCAHTVTSHGFTWGNLFTTAWDTPWQIQPPHM